eukprot:c16736_g1_i1 orf=42-1370(+)
MLKAAPSPLQHLLLLPRHSHRPSPRPRLPVWCADLDPPSSSSRPRVLIISGPTAVGKSSVALQVAKRVNGEIISADSVQVYQGLDVGSAKTPLKDRQGVPHHLIDIVRPEEDYCVGDYFEKSREATELVLAKKSVPILVGGTGMYLRWYLYGQPDAPKSTPEIRALVEQEISKAGGHWDKAVKLLVEAGDRDATKLLRNDWYRLGRRFEVLKASGSPRKSDSLLYTELEGAIEVEESKNLEGSKKNYRSKEDLDYEFLCFFLYTPRDTLYGYIDQRCEEMLTGDLGLLKEASWLLDLGILPNTSPASRAIGYRQAMEYLLQCRQADGVSSPEQFFSFVGAFQKASRNFAKRQLTWFRQEPLYHWIDASQKQEALVDFIVKAYNDPATLTSAASKGTLLVEKQTTLDKRNLLRDYKPRKRIFVTRKDCSQVLDWIAKTQCGKS